MPPPTMATTSSQAFTTSPVPALIARRTPALAPAPPSLSTITHLDTSPSTSSASPSTSNSRPSQSNRRHRSDLAQAVTLPTAAHPVSTRENISTSKTWSSGLTHKHSTRNNGESGIGRGISGEEGEGFKVHPTFRSDAENRGDVLVRVDRVEFWVHKDVLLFSSPFFQSVLGGGWKENRLSQLLQGEVEATEDAPGLRDQETREHGKSTDNASEASEHDTGRELSATIPSGNDAQDKLTTQPVLVAEHADDIPAAELESDDVAASELSSDHLGPESRRGSLLRASYHTALWSQDEENRTSPTLSQCAATFTDAGEDALSAADETDGHSDLEEGGSAGEDEFQDDEEDNKVEAHEADAEKRQEDKIGKSNVADRASPTKVLQPRQRRGSAGLKGVRSKSKHLAARLTLRKLESAQLEKVVPTRSTSKATGLAIATIDSETGLAASSSSLSVGPLERLGSLATPPISRRASNEAPQLLTTAEPASKLAPPTDPNPIIDTQNNNNTCSAPPPSKPTLPKRYQNLKSVIDLVEEQPSTFHDFLHHAYPHLDLSVTWYNCGPLLRFSDKFQVPFLRRSCVTFLRAALAGRPIEAMRLAELHGMDDLYKEASRHVLDNFSVWQPEELEVLSKETLLKLERKRVWFLERLLKLGLANPARDYECGENCPDPVACARQLGERWQMVYTSAFRFMPPQPSTIFRYLRELDGVNGMGEGRQLGSCQQTGRLWVQGLFDRMFELGTLHTSGRLFLAVKLDAQVQRNLSHKE